MVCLPTINSISSVINHSTVFQDDAAVSGGLRTRFLASLLTYNERMSDSVIKTNYIKSVLLQMPPHLFL